ncbi:DUF3027 domain-containing protein [Sediminivirga luteola]|uniref:DUF3027 family protein n=1 Tax=Sediminivirga luteola TaxID=1774748 RepID=A0A8J2XIK1_9MICO|nr:DUF3027 domain-containing protein [Sediminivirga luteola]MCI2265945.1 DUF3027 domain-containing protein [Sediminivirga luteola]GGA03646.1 hypothetical protein GCM10011333_02980 [Sediminivirga luteola]
MKAAKPDAVLAEATVLARQAIEEIAPASEIGEHQGVRAEGQRLVSHYFACTAPGYRGWSWVAVLARVPRSKKATVCETALLPGDDALISPPWVPWEKRLEPGDLRPEDTLPRLDADPALQPGYEQTGAGQEDYEDVTDIDRLAFFELGLGRERVLSPEGLRRAAERWQDSERGPRGEYSRHAEKNCGSCGYLLPIAGGLRQQFGICASEWSPHDGKVVSLDAGCGAHSETDVVHETREPAQPMIDDLGRGLEPTSLR